MSGSSYRHLGWLTAAVVLAGLAHPVDASSAPAPGPPGAARQSAAPLDAVAGRLNVVVPTVVRSAAGAALPGAVRAGRPVLVPVTDDFGVPSVGVGAVVLQITVRDARRRGTVRVGAPTASWSAWTTMVYEARDVAQNQLVVPLDATGQIAVRSSAAAVVGLTVVGWLDTTTSAPDLHVLRAPSRVLDTRSTRPSTARRPAVIDLRRKVALPPDTRAVLAHVSALAPTRHGYVEVRRADTRPLRVPSLPVTRGRQVTQQVVIPLDGRTALAPGSGSTHLVVDVVAVIVGSGPAGLRAAPTQARVIDSRRDRTFTANRDKVVRIAGTPGVPAGADAVTAYVTAVGGSSGGRGLVRPHRKRRDDWTPVAVQAGRASIRTLPVTVPLGPDGAVVLRRSSPHLHVVVDVVAWSSPHDTGLRGPDLGSLELPEEPPEESPEEAEDDPALTPAEQQRTLAARILVGTCTYAMGTWWSSVRPTLLTVPLDYVAGPGSVQRGFERSVKTDPLGDPARRMANVAFALATALATDTWDTERIGHGPQVGRDRAIELITYLVDGHLTSHPDGWGSGWQGSLVGGYVGRAAWLLWDHLDAGTQRAVADLVAFEADHTSGSGLTYLRDRSGAVANGTSAGDSKSEEVSWQAMPVQLALAMMPDSDHRHEWSFTVSRSALAAWARPSDVTSARVVQGRPLTDWLGGSNVEDDGIVRNHDRVAPDYMALVSQSLDQVWVQALVGEPAPESSRALVGPVVRAFTERTFPADQYAAPGGSIYPAGSAEVYYPEGNDWGTGMQLVYALMDTQADAFGVDPSGTSAAYSLWHLEAAAAMQDRHDDASTYGAPDENRTELNYVGREELTGQIAAQTMLTVAVRDADLVAFTDVAWSAS